MLLDTDNQAAASPGRSLRVSLGARSPQVFMEGRAPGGGGPQHGTGVWGGHGVDIVNEALPKPGHRGQKAWEFGCVLLLDRCWRPG